MPIYASTPYSLLSYVYPIYDMFSVRRPSTEKGIICDTLVHTYTHKPQKDCI